MGNWSALTLNVNGMHDGHKWAELWQIIPRYEILCFQEMHLITSQEFAFKLHALHYDWFFSHRTSNSSGVCVGVKRNMGVKTLVKGSVPGRLLALQLQGDINFDLVTVYAPNNSMERSEFFSNFDNLPI